MDFTKAALEGSCHVLDGGTVIRTVTDMLTLRYLECCAVYADVWDLHKAQDLQKWAQRHVLEQLHIQKRLEDTLADLSFCQDVLRHPEAFSEFKYAPVFAWPASIKLCALVNMVDKFRTPFEPANTCTNRISV